MIETAESVPQSLGVGAGTAHRSRNLDIVRAAAALAVLFGHAYQLSGSFLSLSDRRPIYLLISNGAAGVWLFFALSGYLIAGPFVRSLISGDDLPSIRDYSVRRVFRIYPAYFVALAVVFAFGLPIGVQPKWWQYPLHFSLLHNLWPGEEQAIMFASWTLTLEMIFYVFVPLVAKTVRKIVSGPIDASKFFVAIAMAWILSIGWTLVADQTHGPKYELWLRLLFPSVLSMFCPGILVALAVAVWRRTGRPPTPLRWILGHRLATVTGLVPLVLIGCLGNGLTNTTFYDLSRQAFAIAAGLVIALAISIPEPRGSVGNLLGWFGYISYGIYLWQAVIIGVIDHEALRRFVPLAHGGLRAYAVHVVFLLALVLPTAWLSWVFIEQPMIRFGKFGAIRSRRIEARLLTGTEPR